MADAADSTSPLHSALRSYEQHFARPTAHEIIRAQISRDPDAAKSCVNLLDTQVVCIEREIHQLQTISAHTRACRNSLLPVYALPDEVLCEVFINTVYLASDAPSAESPSYCTFAPLYLSHTSSRFRRIVVQRPLIWSTVSLPEEGIHPDFLDAIIQRSQHAPIDLSIVFPQYIEDASRNLLFNAKQCQAFSLRLVSLEVLLPGNLGAVPFIKWIHEAPAPILQTARVRWQGQDLEEAMFLPQLFLGMTPSLTTLSLEYCKHPWTSGMYSSSLKVLKISLSAQPSLFEHEDLTCVLQECQSLEELSLSFYPVNGAYYWSDPRPRSPCRLHNLHSLSLTAEAYQCGEVLSCLDLDPNADIDINISIPVLNTIWQVHDEVLTDPNTIAILKMLARLTQMRVVDIGSRQFRGHNKLEGEPPWIFIDMDYIDYPPEIADAFFEEAIEWALRSPSLSSISSLIVSYGHTLTPHQLSRWLEISTNVTALSFCSFPAIDEYLDALTNASRHNESFCNNMRELEFLNGTINASAFLRWIKSWKAVADLAELRMLRCRFDESWDEIVDWLNVATEHRIKQDWLNCSLASELPLN